MCIISCKWYYHPLKWILHYKWMVRDVWISIYILYISNLLMYGFEINIWFYMIPFALHDTCISFTWSYTLGDWWCFGLCSPCESLWLHLWFQCTGVFNPLAPWLDLPLMTKWLPQYQRFGLRNLKFFINSSPVTVRKWSLMPWSVWHPAMPTHRPTFMDGLGPGNVSWFVLSCWANSS